jgi:4-hydroxy-3-methylbut-2-enyl diphosphate reductase IspH
MFQVYIRFFNLIKAQNLKIEIDNKSGFCFGVVKAIAKAEEELGKGNTLYCLGDIVHNEEEVERLQQWGLLLSIMSSSITA